MPPSPTSRRTKMQGCPPPGDGPQLVPVAKLRGRAAGQRSSCGETVPDLVRDGTKVPSVLSDALSDRSGPPR